MQPRHDHPSRRITEAALVAALTAYRDGGTAAWVLRYPRVMRWLRGRWLAPVFEAFGDAVPSGQRDSTALDVLLKWALTQLRPDRQPTLSLSDEEAWIQRTSWRPLLAVACQYGFLVVPAFPSHYRRRAEEGVVDNLCGLWSVGPSTFYRYLDKGKRLLVDQFAESLSSGRRMLALRQAAQERLRESAEPRIGWLAWHFGEAESSLARGAVSASLWHSHQAGDDNSLIRTLQRFALQAANGADTDLLIEQVMLRPLSPRQQFELALARAALWRNRRADDRELEALNHALRLAHAQTEPLLIGVAFGALGKFHESRDTDRAFACYEEGVAQLQQAQPVEGYTTAPAAEYASSLIRLAWLHVRRNDPRAKALLDRVQQLRQEFALPDGVLGELEQTWGEYWRRAGELRKALDHKHRALNQYERSGDRRSVLTTYLNLSLIYGEARDFEHALDYGQKVLDAEKGMVVEPEIIVGAHGNLGITHFFRGDFTAAIASYRHVLTLAEAAGLRQHIGTTHYNLAEAYYKQFQQTSDPEDERLGDAHAATATRIGTADNAPSLVEAGKGLKREILGTGGSIDRLVPEEFAAHFSEMTEVQRLRAALALPRPPQDQARTHLALARMYLAIAGKEREAAKALIDKHGLGDTFTDEFTALRTTFERELTREQQLTQAWQDRSGDLLGAERRQSVLTHVLAQGSINKSAYAEVADVSLATASKHLGVLAERGLLVQTGKGPSTRYLLPTDT